MKNRFFFNLPYVSWKYKLSAFMFSQGLSLLGSTVVSLAIIWYITLKTGSASMVTYVTLTTFIPQAMVMLYGGILADRYSPKLIVILSDSIIALSTLTLAILFFLGIDNINWIFLFNIIRSLGTGIQLPASKSILPQIVPSDKILKANSLSTGIWSVVQLISPGLGGIVMNQFNIQFIFLIDVITAIIGIIILVTIYIPISEKRLNSKNNTDELLQGFEYIMKSKTLRNCIVLFSVFQFLVVPASQLSPLLATLNIGNEVWMLSVIETFFSIGALSISIIMAYKEFNVPQYKLIGLSSIIFGVTMILLLPIRSIMPFIAVMFIMGVGSPLYYTALITKIHENTDEAFMGRTFSFLDLFSSFATPFGMLVFGPIANLSIILSFAIPGILLIMLGIFIYSRMR